MNKIKVKKTSENIIVLDERNRQIQTGDTVRLTNFIRRLINDGAIQPMVVKEKGTAKGDK